MFTDEAIDTEIIDLEESIEKKKCEIEDAERSIKSLNEQLKQEEEYKQKRINEAATLPSYVAGYSTFNCDTTYYDRMIKWIRDNKNYYGEKISEDQTSILKYVSEISKRKKLKLKTPIQRADDYYKELCKRKENPATTAEGFIELSKEFGKMEGYEKSAEFAIACVERAVKVMYDDLVREKDNASTEKQFRELSDTFKAMNGYADTAKLALECDNEYRRRKEARETREREEKERRRQEEERRRQEEEHRRQEEERQRQERYDLLVRKMEAVTTKGKAASTEEEMAFAEKKYKRLAEEFGKLNYYKNAKELSNKCDAERSALSDERTKLIRRRERSKKIQKWLLVFVLGCIIGGVGFAFLNNAVDIDLNAQSDMGSVMIAVIVVGMLFGIITMRDGGGCFYGCGGFFFGALMTFFSVIFLTSNATTAIIGGVVMGGIMGAVIGGVMVS